MYAWNVLKYVRKVKYVVKVLKYVGKVLKYVGTAALGRPPGAARQLVQAN